MKLRAIDGQRIQLKGKRLSDGSEDVKAVVGDSVVWGRTFDKGTTAKQIRDWAKAELEELGIINDD